MYPVADGSSLAVQGGLAGERCWVDSCCVDGQTAVAAFDVPTGRALRPNPGVIADRCLASIHATRHALPPAKIISCLIS